MMAAVSYSPLFGVFPLDTTTKVQVQPSIRGAIADSIIGAAAGSTVTVSHTRTLHSDNATAKDGGLVPLESNSDFNRATTAQDVTNFKGAMKPHNAGAFGFVRDLSGNGGPAFTRTVVA